MSAIRVAVEATVPSAMGPPTPMPTGGRGWSVGVGVVPDTLGEDAQPVRAMVLMTPGAHPGVQVQARPVALLHTQELDRPVDEVLCVADDEVFTPLADVADLPSWHADPAAWAEALGLVAPGGPPTVLGCESRRAAEDELNEAERAFQRLTGCLE